MAQSNCKSFLLPCVVFAMISYSFCNQIFYKVATGTIIDATHFHMFHVNFEHECLGECFLMEKCKSFVFVEKVDGNKFCMFYKYDRCDNDMLSVSNRQYLYSGYFDTHQRIQLESCTFHVELMGFNLFLLPIILDTDKVIIVTSLKKPDEKYFYHKDGCLCLQISNISGCLEFSGINIQFSRSLKCNSKDFYHLSMKEKKKVFENGIYQFTTFIAYAENNDGQKSCLGFDGEKFENGVTICLLLKIYIKNIPY